MARLMLSAGIFSCLAASTALRRRGFLSGSPPDLAAMLISLIRRVKTLPRLASSAPFLCLIVAHFEWPDIARPRVDFLSRAQKLAFRMQRSASCCRQTKLYRLRYCRDKDYAARQARGPAARPASLSMASEISIAGERQKQRPTAAAQSGRPRT